MALHSRPPKVEKLFDELTKEELRSLIRKMPRYFPSEILTLYNITPEQYLNKIKEVGLQVTNDDRRVYRSTPMKIQIIESYEPIDLMAMRMYRGYSIEQFSKMSKLHPSAVRKYEKSKYPIPTQIGKLYVQTLGIRESELKRLRMYLKGETDSFEQDREIPPEIKDQVRTRDKNKCSICGSKKKLHFHHIKHFADGGLHQVGNIKLLCVACHAEQHKGERPYYLLKRMMEE